MSVTYPWSDEDTSEFSDWELDRFAEVYDALISSPVVYQGFGSREFSLDPDDIKTHVRHGRKYSDMIIVRVPTITMSHEFVFHKTGQYGCHLHELNSRYERKNAYMADRVVTKENYEERLGKLDK